MRPYYEVGVYYELRDLADHLNGVGNVEVVAVDTSRRPMVVLFKVKP